MKLHNIAFACVASLGMVGSSHAALVSGLSEGDVSGGLRLGAAYDGSGTAGAGVDGQLLNLNASFENHLKDFIINDPDNEYGGAYDEATGIYTLAAGVDLASIPFPHTGLGVWAFKQVGSSDIWFGEWSKEVTDANGNYTGTGDASTRTVFFTGDDTGTSVPTTGTATYSVSGINNGANLTGSFSADFGAGTVGGTLTGSGTVTSLTVAGTFSSGSAAIGGTASASGTSGTDTSGEVVGSFYGANAASIAGIANFDTRAYDTAFGGVKQ